LPEGRAIAMRNAGTTSPIGGGYACAFNDWLLYNRFDMDLSDRARLLTVMGILPEIERWRMSLPPTQRLRMNHPGTVLLNYRKGDRGRRYQVGPGAHHRAASGAITLTTTMVRHRSQERGSNPAPWRTSIVAVVGS